MKSNYNLIRAMNLMRQIDNEVKPKWDQIKSGKKLERADEDCSPSLIKGWTDDNPSLWEIDNPDKPAREKVLIALCRRKKEWDKITFLIFDKCTIDASNLSITQTNGNTGDSKIDTSKSHHEIINIGGKSLCTLIYHITMSDFEIGHFKKSDFDKILLSAYDNSQVISHSKTDTMSTQPSLIGAITDTVNKDIFIPNDNITKIDKSITSGSIDSTSETSSSTSS